MRRYLVLLVCAVLSLCAIMPCFAEAEIETARPSVNGRLHVEGRQLTDAAGKAVQLLYDRIPTLPQSLKRDFGAWFDLWQNIAHRVARTAK